MHPSKQATKQIAHVLHRIAMSLKSITMFLKWSCLNSSGLPLQANKIAFIYWLFACFYFSHSFNKFSFGSLFVICLVVLRLDSGWFFFEKKQSVSGCVSAIKLWLHRNDIGNECVNEFAYDGDKAGKKCIQNVFKVKLLQFLFYVSSDGKRKRTRKEK